MTEKDMQTIPEVERFGFGAVDLIAAKCSGGAFVLYPDYDRAVARADALELEVAHWKNEAQSYKPAWDATKAELATLKATLEQERKDWQTWGVIEIAVRNPNVASYMQHWEERATKAEATLDEMRKQLEYANKQKTMFEELANNREWWLTQMRKPISDEEWLGATKLHRRSIICRAAFDRIIASRTQAKQG